MIPEGDGILVNIYNSFHGYNPYGGFLKWVYPQFSFRIDDIYSIETHHFGVPHFRNMETTNQWI